jgi:hypothetical protein
MSSSPSETGAASLRAALEARRTLPLAQRTPQPDGLPAPVPDSRPSPNPSRRREKPQLSCHLCRRRK